MFPTPEINLMVIFNPGARLGLMEELGNMLGFLSDDETELRDLAVGVIQKLQSITDEDFAALDLIPDMLTLKGR